MAKYAGKRNLSGKFDRLWMKSIVLPSRAAQVTTRIVQVFVCDIFVTLTIFTSSVWNIWPRIADVFLRVSHVVAGANERRGVSKTRGRGRGRGLGRGRGRGWVLFVKLKSQVNASLCSLQYTLKVQSFRNLDSHRTSELAPPKNILFFQITDFHEQNNSFYLNFTYKLET